MGRHGIWIGLALLGAGACGGGSTAGGDTASGQDTAVVGDTVVADGQVTGDTAGGADTGGSSSFECHNDEDCTASGAICDCHGACVVPTGNACTEDKNCGIPNWCDTCTGHCAPQGDLCEACADARGCQDGGACLPYQSGGTYCGRACVTDVGCPTGYGCVAVNGVTQKQCVARSNSCTNLDVCHGDEDCPSGEICNAQLGQCAPGCTEDIACPQGLVCTAARCQAKCTGNGDCVAPAECDASGHCKIPGACEVKADCPTPETYCNKVTGMCADGCLVDNDCGDAAKICENKSCVPKGCEHNYQCQFSHECTQTSGACDPSPDPHCADCSDTGTYACEGDGELCASIQDENEQPLGDFCLLPCKDDPIDKCPAGYQCNEVEVEEGKTQFICWRQCWIDPVGSAASGGN